MGRLTPILWYNVGNQKAGGTGHTPTCGNQSERD